jgi:hypothetical protein
MFNMFQIFQIQSDFRKRCALQLRSRGRVSMTPCGSDIIFDEIDFGIVVIWKQLGAWGIKEAHPGEVSI